MGRRPLTGVSMATFAHLYPHHVAGGNKQTGPTLSQDFDMDAAWVRVLAMLAVLYGDDDNGGESDDSPE